LVQPELPELPAQGPQRVPPVQREPQQREPPAPLSQPEQPPVQRQRQGPRHLERQPVRVPPAQQAR
jgi:hypothetical protein